MIGKEYDTIKRRCSELRGFIQQHIRRLTNLGLSSDEIVSVVDPLWSYRAGLLEEIEKWRRFDVLRFTEVTGIVAYDDFGGIGKDGGIPWRHPEDLKFFSEITRGEGNNGLIMGRKTWDSLPKRPLEGRKNVVLSRTQQGLGNATLRDLADCDRVFVIGGAEIYQLLLPMCDDVFISHIPGNHFCDVFFDPTWLDGFERLPDRVRNITHMTRRKCD